MRMYDLILKKRQGKPLTKDEIQWMIREYTDGKMCIRDSLYCE